ncbi:hypothetical protein ACWCWD_11740 [Streptomyces sp. NPDC001493]
MKRLALKVLAPTMLAVSASVMAATPSVAQEANNTCSTFASTSDNYEYKCEFWVYPLASTTEGGVIKNAIFTDIITDFNKYFPLSGCPDKLSVGLSCSLKDPLGVTSNPIKVTEIGTNYYTVKTLPGHAEGEDRYIKFALYITDNELRLGVDSWGKPSLASKATVSSGGATVLWQSFAENITAVFG